ncbi:MAG TPA: FHA domain-containing protein [Phycisphaerales bacterium]|nr:FHA domain-containing protein [Phycisphaerales bacterium]
MDASFVLVTQDLTQRVVPMNRPRIVIGRHTDCYIRIPTSEVSRQHCEVLTENDEIRIRDLGSSNGTYVNRKKVSESPLKAGDLISVGPCVFVVRIDGEPAEIDADEAYEDGLVSTTASPPAAAAASATSPTTITKRPSAPSPSKPAKGKSILDDSEKDPDDSDAFDFDFSDDDDEKKTGR